MEKEKEEMSKEEIYNCLKGIDFMLYNYAYEPSRCAPFQSYEDMASFLELCYILFYQKNISIMNKLPPIIFGLSNIRNFFTMFYFRKE